MTDTKEFNKSLDRIAKALGGEEWSPEDKPEAIYKLLDKIADVLEENASSKVLNINASILPDTEYTTYTLDKTFNEIHTAFSSGIPCIVLDGTSELDEKNLVLNTSINEGYDSYVYVYFQGAFQNFGVGPNLNDYPTFIDS